MRITALLLFLLMVTCELLLSACAGENQATQSPAVGSSGQLDRPTPPAEYADKTNPHAGDQAAAEAGAKIYQTNCAACHGDKGKGDGPAATSLNPKPQNLADNSSKLSDAYLFWRISEGGGKAPFNSVMPAWKSILTEDQIWQVINHLHTFGS